MSNYVSEYIGAAEVIAARFDNQNDADMARRTLEARGYDPRELSFISDAAKCSFTFDGVGDHAAKAAAEGIVGGSVIGAAVSAGAAVVAMGSLVLLGPIGILTGAALGGFTGALLGLGVNSDQAVACEKAISGGFLVMAVQARAGDSASVRSALGTHLIASEEDSYFTSKASPIDVKTP